MRLCLSAPWAAGCAELEGSSQWSREGGGKKQAEVGSGVLFFFLGQRAGQRLEGACSRAWGTEVLLPWGS